MSDNQRTRLRVPCSYQGGKQRIAAEIVDEITRHIPSTLDGGYRFYDLCCGSGAITIELLNRGVRASSITMLDASSWGAFWNAIGSGVFDLNRFRALISDVPQDKARVKSYMEQLARQPVDGEEAELYPILQACSFGGKQIWLQDGRWQNAFFRDYWLPNERSVRKSPANPMQPSASTLLARIETLANSCLGLTCLHEDINSIFRGNLDANSIVYVDPPYRQSTGYAFTFSLDDFIKKFQSQEPGIPLFVSEGKPLTDSSVHLRPNGAKGGISGTRKGRHEEWLTLYL